MLCEVEFKLRSASLQNSATSPRGVLMMSLKIEQDIMSVTCVEAFREQSSTFATLPQPQLPLEFGWSRFSYTWAEFGVQ